MADTLNNIFISEILADNAGGAAIDTDGDGNIKKSDEFIELQNASNTAVSLDGFEVWSEKEGLLYSFGPSDTIAAGGTATVVGNYTGTPPAGFYDAGINENGNFIPDGENNKFDTIFLVNTNTGEYITLSYGDPDSPMGTLPKRLLCRPGSLGPPNWVPVKVSTVMRQMAQRLHVILMVILLKQRQHLAPLIFHAS